MCDWFATHSSDSIRFISTCTTGNLMNPLGIGYIKLDLRPRVEVLLENLSNEIHLNLFPMVDNISWSAVVV